MAVKSDRLEARVSPEQRARLELAATISGTSVSAFVVDAAVERAEELVAAQTSTTVPADYFDRLVSAIDELDGWLRLHARNAAAQGTRTFVVIDEGDTVVGYFAIAPHVVNRADAPNKVGRGAPRQIPAILLAKLALSGDRHGQGLGAELFVRALGTIIDAARAAGGKVVVVDAIDEGEAAFYRHHDFDALPNRPDRLVMKLSTAARALGVAWP